VCSEKALDGLLGGIHAARDAELGGATGASLRLEGMLAWKSRRPNGMTPTNFEAVAAAAVMHAISEMGSK
jgi:hypothetical protein